MSWLAPGRSRMMRESIIELTLKAMRPGKLALMLPVMMDVVGRCVASASRADSIEFPIDFPMFCDLVSPADIAKWNSTIAEANEKKSEKEQ